jgi:cytidylate kinase
MNEDGRRLRPIVAIDGPAGAGKSTLAAYLARRFGFLNLDTGAMYRAFALKALERAVPLDDEPALLAMAESTQIQLEPLAGEGVRVLLDGRDVSSRIRDKDVTEAASRISVHPAVRAWLVRKQQAMGAAGGVVMEGRDIGTHVFPDADVKIYLDADPNVRGRRRFLQQSAAGKPQTAESAVAAVKERDQRDRSRTASPLQPATDAIHLDSPAMTLEEMCQWAEVMVREKNR